MGTETFNIASRPRLD